MEIAKVKDGVMLYATRHMMPKMDSKGQFVLGLALGAASGRLETLLRSLEDNGTVKALGLIHDGELDWDTLYGAAMAQMQRQKTLTLDIPMIGRLTFDEQDLRDLHVCIKGGVN